MLSHVARAQAGGAGGDDEALGAGESSNGGAARLSPLVFGWTVFALHTVTLGALLVTFLLQLAVCAYG